MLFSNLSHLKSQISSLAQLRLYKDSEGEQKLQPTKFWKAFPTNLLLALQPAIPGPACTNRAPLEMGALAQPLVPSPSLGHSRTPQLLPHMPSVRPEPSCPPISQAPDPSTGCAFRSEAISSSPNGDDVTLLDSPYSLFSELPPICAILQLKAWQLIHSEGRCYWGWIKEQALSSTDFYSFRVAKV